MHTYNKLSEENNHNLGGAILPRQKMDEEYWNPLLETLPHEKIRQLQLVKFKEIFTWAYGNSKFYRKLYTDAGIEPGDIRTFDDIS